MSLDQYRAFCIAKRPNVGLEGFPCEPSECNPILKPHQADMVAWAVRGGRRGIFTAFGLGKTMIQLEIVRLTLAKSGGRRGLIVMPLGVRQEFKRDAAMLGTEVTFTKVADDSLPAGIYLTNYESVRDGKIDPKLFDVVSLDEASCLRGFGGTKTFREMMRHFEGSGIYRFVATATPSPNDYIELLAYAAFLDVMDVGQAKTRFFKRNSEKADELTIREGREEEFWHWIASWAVFVQAPSDLGYSDEGYELPPIEVHWHELPSNHDKAGFEKSGQSRMFRDTSLGVTGAASEKRDSLTARIEKLLELRALEPEAHRVIWHDLEAERKAIEKACPGIATVYGSQPEIRQEDNVVGFSNGTLPEIAGKPCMLGSGVNFQRHCHWAIFLGIGFKFNDFIQAIHRLQRFLQTSPVRIDLIYTEAERGVRSILEEKWEKHKTLVANMREIIRKYGLSEAAIAASFSRASGVERIERAGPGWKMVQNDCVEELFGMPEGSVDLVVTSIPFGTQYEYSPNLNDFGHTDDNEHFWAQMGFFIPELLRVMRPGRVACIHVKDRITPGGINGYGFQTVHPFSDECVAEFRKHGFAYLGRRTVVTDVVRENAQTYRLGWSEVCKDSTRIGSGMPEYVLVFRKPQTDRTRGYGDIPVTHSKGEYTRARWQFDAHGMWKSSGDRLLMPEDLAGKAHNVIYKLFKRHSEGCVYDHELDVRIAEEADRLGVLPPSFMLLQPHSNHEDVWTDIARMRTLNSTQKQGGREMHLCPLQFDIADRLIRLFSNPGEVVMDPFAGIGTVPVRAVKHGRFGLGIELSAMYFGDSLWNLERTVGELSMPTLFDIEDEPELAEAAV